MLRDKRRPSCESKRPEEEHVRRSQSWAGAETYRGRKHEVSEIQSKCGQRESWCRSSLDQGRHSLLWQVKLGEGHASFRLPPPYPTLCEVFTHSVSSMQFLQASPSLTKVGKMSLAEAGRRVNLGNSLRGIINIINKELLIPALTIPLQAELGTSLLYVHIDLIQLRVIPNYFGIFHVLIYVHCPPPSPKGTQLCNYEELFLCVSGTTQMFF